MFRLPAPALFLSLTAGALWIHVAPCEAHADEPCCRGCASERCCAAKVCATCVPIPDVVKISTPVYRCKGVDFCLPKRSLLDLFRSQCDQGCGSGCGDCGCSACPCPRGTCPQCECHPRQRMVLLKRIVTTECPPFTCEPAHDCANEPWFEEMPLPADLPSGPGDVQPKKPVPPSAKLPRHRAARKAR